MARKIENIIGNVYGRLIVVENLNIKSHGSTLHKCVCCCGNVVNVPKSYLLSGHTKSCGCLKLETQTKHGMSNTRIYNIYMGIKKRCYNKNCKAYKDYGGRGIVMCSQWLKSFNSFYRWAILSGYKENLTIERIDVNGNYEPNNCCWIEKSEQTKNMTKNVFIEYQGKKQTLSEWSKETKIPLTTLHRRIKQYKDLDIAFTKGIINHNRSKK